MYRHIKQYIIILISYILINIYYTFFKHTGIEDDSKRILDVVVGWYCYKINTSYY